MHLVSLSISEPEWLEGVAWSPHTLKPLEGNQEWGKLEYWMGIVWMVWLLETCSTTEEDILCVTVLLFC